MDEQNSQNKPDNPANPIEKQAETPANSVEEQAETPANSVEEQAKKPVTEQADDLQKAIENVGGRKALAARFGVADIELSKPFEWCGVVYEKVHLDFASLTGRDMEAIEDELEARGIRTRYPADNRRYLKTLAAKAGKIPADAITNLPAADYNAIVNAAQYFLTFTG